MDTSPLEGVPLHVWCQPIDVVDEPDLLSPSHDEDTAAHVSSLQHLPSSLSVAADALAAIIMHATEHVMAVVTPSALRSFVARPSHSPRVDVVGGGGAPSSPQLVAILFVPMQLAGCLPIALATVQRLTSTASLCRRLEHASRSLPGFPTRMRGDGATSSTRTELAPAGSAVDGSVHASGMKPVSSPYPSAEAIAESIHAYQCAFVEALKAVHVRHFADLSPIAACLSDLHLQDEVYPVWLGIAGIDDLVAGAVDVVAGSHPQSDAMVVDDSGVDSGQHDGASHPGVIAVAVAPVPRTAPHTGASTTLLSSGGPTGTPGHSGGSREGLVTFARLLALSTATLKLVAARVPDCALPAAGLPPLPTLALSVVRPELLAIRVLLSPTTAEDAVGPFELQEAQPFALELGRVSQMAVPPSPLASLLRRNGAHIHVLRATPLAGGETARPQAFVPA